MYVEIIFLNMRNRSAIQKSIEIDNSYYFYKNIYYFNYCKQKSKTKQIFWQLIKHKTTKGD